MTAYRPLVLVSGVTTQLPPGIGIVGNSLTSDEGSISFRNNVVTSATSGVLIDAFPSGDYSTAVYSVQASRGVAVHSTEIKLIHDSTTVYTSEYGTVYTSGLLATYSGTISAGNVEVNAYGNEAASTQYRIIRYAQSS